MQVRRPTLDEIAVASSPDPADDVFPSIDVYDDIACQLTVVIPGQGFYAERRDAVQDVVSAAVNRQLIDVDFNHNVPMTHPIERAAIIQGLLPHPPD